MIFSFYYHKKRKHSGVYLLPMLIINISYRSLTFALFIFVVEIILNTFDKECCNCGAICKNYKDADNHCLENLGF